MTSSGSSAMARASATRRAMPPDTCEGIRSRAPRRPTASSFISTMSRTSGSVSVVCSRSGKATLSNTDKSVNSAPNWNSMPIRRRAAYRRASSMAPTSWPSTSTVPVLARCWPPIRRSTVVLPPPDAPISTVTWPRGTVSDKSRSTGRSSYPKVTLRSSTRAGGCGAGAVMRDNKKAGESPAAEMIAIPRVARRTGPSDGRKTGRVATIHPRIYYFFDSFQH